MSPILEVQDLSKRFRIQHEKQVYLNLRDRIFSFLKPRIREEEFWALRDLNFSIMPGDSLGIIGRNGAGKSTLLKILSRITPPTSGKIITRGKVASLLEVGTGFHPELTGRENIFLNGSILGMKRHEVAARFDEIVDFAGTEKFLDTQLKHYSSGMQLRLAFAVAAFLEPQILVIDEVLAVGDAEFQKKCIGKMGAISKSGRTLLFVSHNLTAVESLCSRSILLRDGMLVEDGTTSEIVKKYLNQGTNVLPDKRDLQNARRQGSGKVKFVSVGLKNRSFVHVGEKIEFVVELDNKENLAEKQLYLAITVFNQHGVKLTTLDNLYTEQRVILKKGKFRVHCSVQRAMLTPGQYRIDLWCADSYETYDMVDEAFILTVEPSDFFGTGKIHDQSKHGNFLVENYWTNV